MSKSISDELDEIDLMIGVLDVGEPPHYAHRDKIRQAILNLINEARIDELEKLPFDRNDSWGRYVLEKEVKERLAQLKGKE